MTLDTGLVSALGAVEDLAAEFSDLLEREGWRLALPAGAAPPTIPGSRLIGRALTIRYLPVRRESGSLRREDPDGKLGNKRLQAAARPGDVMVVQSPFREVSVIGSEAAAALNGVGVAGAIVDGAVRDLEGLARLPFPCWVAGRTPVTGRWRIEAAELGGPVAICGVQVMPGDVVVADDSGVAFVPEDRFGELAERLLHR